MSHSPENDPMFKVSFSNIPIIDLRHWFREYLFKLRQDDFRKQFTGEIHNIETPYFLWYNRSEPLLNLMLQQAILGLEAYVSAAVFIEAGRRGVPSPEIVVKIQSPFSLGRSTANNLFNKLPELIDPKLQLTYCDKALWEKARLFYSEIRNPLFHGRVLDPVSPELVLSMFEFIARIYGWVDGWHDINRDELGSWYLTNY